MKTIKSCEFNTTGCAELRFRDGSMIFIDCIAAENEVADNRLRRSEPVCLIRNSETENAAARRAFRQTRRADTDCARPPLHIPVIADVLTFQSELQFGAPVSGRIRRCCLLTVFV